MQAEKFQAIVLSTIDYGESDRIASLFTLEHGRIRVFARNARKSRKRFGAALETFARIEAQARLKEDGLSSIHQAEIITIYPGIRADLLRIAQALYACELVEAMTPEGYPLPRLYRLLAARLDRLETGISVENDRRFFEVNLLNVLGYRPPLENCGRCETHFGSEGALLQQDGEPLCPACASTGRPIATETLKALLACMETGRFGQINFQPEFLAQAGELLDKAISSHVVRDIKSLGFLRQVTNSSQN